MVCDTPYTLYADPPSLRKAVKEYRQRDEYALFITPDTLGGAHGEIKLLAPVHRVAAWHDVLPVATEPSLTKAVFTLDTAKLFLCFYNPSYKLYTPSLMSYSIHDGDGSKGANVYVWTKVQEPMQYGVYYLFAAMPDGINSRLANDNLSGWREIDPPEDAM